jgi:glycine/D-amino acid oxidase-like deaminating enzyme
MARGLAPAVERPIRALRQEVHHVAPRAGLPVTGLPHVGDADLGTYFRPEPCGGLLVGGQEPECDPLQWLDDPDGYHPHPTTAVYEAQVTRLARRLPDLPVVLRPSGIAGVYDVTDDWIPVYDRPHSGGTGTAGAPPAPFRC